MTSPDLKRLDRLYFKKYDDQMSGLDPEEEKEFNDLHEKLEKALALQQQLAGRESILTYDRKCNELKQKIKTAIQENKKRIAPHGDSCASDVVRALEELIEEDENETRK